MALTLTQKMKIMSGYCSSCGADLVVQDKNGKKKFSESYRQHILKLSNNTLMRVGVCMDCKILLTTGKNVQKTADTIIANHKTYWSNNPKFQPKDFETIVVSDPNSNLSKFNRELSLENHFKEVEKQEADKLNVKTISV